MRLPYRFIAGIHYHFSEVNDYECPSNTWVSSPTHLVAGAGREGVPWTLSGTAAWRALSQALEPPASCASLASFCCAGCRRRCDPQCTAPADIASITSLQELHFQFTLKNHFALLAFGPSQKACCAKRPADWDPQCTAPAKNGRNRFLVRSVPATKLAARIAPKYVSSNVQHVQPGQASLLIPRCLWSSPQDLLDAQKVHEYLLSKVQPLQQGKARHCV